jgi:hypothetical protein
VLREVQVVVVWVLPLVPGICRNAITLSACPYTCPEPVSANGEFHKKINFNYAKKSVSAPNASSMMIMPRRSAALRNFSEGGLCDVLTALYPNDLSSSSRRSSARLHQRSFVKTSAPYICPTPVLKKRFFFFI